MPFALGAAYVATGEIPDWTTEEGKTALGGYAFVLINFARLIVPARIARRWRSRRGWTRTS